VAGDERRILVTRHTSLFHWIWSQPFDLGGQFGGGERKLPAHRRRQVDHLDAPSFQADLLQQLTDVFDALARSEITFQVMTIAFQSARHQHTIRAILERAQYVQRIEFSSARQLDDLDRSRVLQAHAACQIGGGIRAIVTAEGDDLWLKAIVSH